MKKTTESKRGIIIPCLKAQLIWVGATIILMLIFCSVAYSLEDPDSVTVPLSLCALYVSSIICGIAAVKISGDGIVSGALSGGITALLLLCLSALPLPEGVFEMPISFFLILLVIPSSIVGAILGHKRKKARRSPKHKRNR